jgi:hypothetical protein
MVGECAYRVGEQWVAPAFGAGHHACHIRTAQGRRRGPADLTYSAVFSVPTEP